MSDFKIASEFIETQKMTRSFARKLLIKWYIEREIDLSDIGLDCTVVNF